MLAVFIKTSKKKLAPTVPQEGSVVSHKKTETPSEPLILMFLIVSLCKSAGTPAGLLSKVFTSLSCLHRRNKMISRHHFISVSHSVR